MSKAFASQADLAEKRFAVAHTTFQVEQVPRLLQIEEL